MPLNKNKSNSKKQKKTKKEEKKKRRRRRKKRKKKKRRRRRRRIWGITQTLLTVYKSFLVLQSQGCHSMKIT